MPKNWYSGPYQRYYDFAIGVGLEVVRMLQLLAQDSMIIDLAIDGERQRSIIIDKRLGASICIRSE